jgi:tRNA pseudouridine55 synthase
MATGVLPVFVGRATRGVEFAEQGEKEYIAGLRLGLVTDTQDTTGEILERKSVSCSREDVEAVLSRFRGEIQQIPPMYSALKVNGQKLYQLARKGKTVERKPRSITIYELELGEQTGAAEYQLRVKCSKGTYVRTLCHDIGQALGCGGCMSALRRTMAAGFDLSQAVTLETVIQAAEQGSVEALLLPVDTYFRQYPALSVNAEAERRCRNGNSFRSRGADGMYRVYGQDGGFLMLGERKQGVMRTIKSFFEV